MMGFFRIDAGFYKTFPIKELMKVVFSATSTNVTNHPNWYYQPYPWTGPTGINSSPPGYINSLANSNSNYDRNYMRAITFQLAIEF